MVNVTRTTVRIEMSNASGVRDEIYFPDALRRDFGHLPNFGHARRVTSATTAPRGAGGRALLSARVGVEVVLAASSAPEPTEVARPPLGGCHN